MFGCLHEPRVRRPHDARSRRHKSSRTHPRRARRVLHHDVGGHGRRGAQDRTAADRQIGRLRRLPAAGQGARHRHQLYEPQQEKPHPQPERPRRPSRAARSGQRIRRAGRGLSARRDATAGRRLRHAAGAQPAPRLLLAERVRPGRPVPRLPGPRSQLSGAERGAEPDRPARRPAVDSPQHRGGLRRCLDARRARHHVRPLLPRADRQGPVRGRLLPRHDHLAPGRHPQRARLFRPRHAADPRAGRIQRRVSLLQRLYHQGRQAVVDRLHRALAMEQRLRRHGPSGLEGLRHEGHGLLAAVLGSPSPGT